MYQSSGFHPLFYSIGLTEGKNLGSLVLVIALAKIIGLGSEHTARGSHIVLLLVSPVSFRRILVIIPLLLGRFSVLGLVTQRVGRCKLRPG